MQRILVSLALSLLASSGIAQCFDSSYATHTPLGVGPDLVFGMQPIGFAFPIGATTYANIHVCDKCYAWLSNAGVPAPGGADFSPTSAELASQSPRVCALWADIQAQAANSAQVYIQSTAAKCTVTWHNVQCYSTTSGIFDVQMQLFPSGQANFIYGPGTTNNSTIAAWQVGITGVSPGLGAVLPASSNLSAGGLTADPTVYEEWLLPNTFDMAGTSLQLIPTNPGYAFVNSTPTGCATTSNYGTGCYQSNDSYYEYFASAAAFDLAGRTLTMLRQANGYIVLDAIPGVFVPPGGGAVQVAPGDDAVQTVAITGAMPIPGGTTSSLAISSNGNVALSATDNGTSWTPLTATFLGWAQTAVAVWHDYQNALPGSGVTTFEQVGNIVYVTWSNVFSFGTTPVTGDTFQFQFNVTTGDITLVFTTMTPAGNGYLVGYSRGGASSDPGATDLSASPVNLMLGDVGNLGLALTASGLPTVGNALFALATSNVPNLVPLAFMFFGDTALPGIDLGFINAPNCRAYTNGNLGSFTFPVTLPAGTGSLTVSIPPNAGLIGATLTSQSVAFTLANALNLATSNGTSFTIGN